MSDIKTLVEDTYGKAVKLNGTPVVDDGIAAAIHIHYLPGMCFAEATWCNNFRIRYPAKEDKFSRFQEFDIEESLFGLSAKLERLYEIYRTNKKD